MKVGVLICGTDDWDKNFFPLIDSIKKYEPTVEICAMGTTKPPLDKKFSGAVSIGHSDKVDGYATAINFAYISLVMRDDGFREFDWILVMNSDVRCTAPFVDYLKKLNNKTLYGNKIHRNHKQSGMPIDFIDGWIYAIPATAFEDVGYFDMQFKIAGFEDADYCLRAFNAGYSIGQSELPFKHLEHRPRMKTEGYKGTRLENLNYLKEKHGLNSV